MIGKCGAVSMVLFLVSTLKKTESALYKYIMHRFQFSEA